MVDTTEEVQDWQPTPAARVTARAVSLFEAAIAIEGQIATIDDLDVLDRKLAESVDLLQGAIADSPSFIAAYNALARHYWFQGQYDQSIRTFNEAAARTRKVIEDAGWDVDFAIFLPGNCTEIIGLMGHLDTFAKHKILTGDPRPYMLLIPRGHKVVNWIYLSYWRELIDIVDDPKKISKLWKFRHCYSAEWNWVFPRGDEGLVHTHTGRALVHKRWDAKMRGAPLITLKREHTNVAARQKRAWGMRSDDWHVCLHVRSEKFYKDGVTQNFRNSAIEDYYDAIRSITDAGGWVIRMGDPSSPPLDASRFPEWHHKVVDYAHSIERSEVLDVALGATCRLHLCSNTGLYVVPLSFGRTVCMVNVTLYAGIPVQPRQVFLPKRYFSHALGRFLSLREIFEQQLVYADHQFLLERAKVELVDNSAEEIVEVTREVLFPEQFEGEAYADGRRVREHFLALNREFRCECEAYIGLHHAQTHARTLLPDAF